MLKRNKKSLCITNVVTISSQWLMMPSWDINERDGANCSRTSDAPFPDRMSYKTTKLNQALSVFFLRLDFLSVSLVLLLLWPLFALCYFVLFVCSVSWLFLLGCQYQCKWLTGKTPVRNVDRGRQTILTHSLTHPWRRTLVSSSESTTRP